MIAITERRIRGSEPPFSPTIRKENIAKSLSLFPGIEHLSKLQDRSTAFCNFVYQKKDLNVDKRKIIYNDLSRNKENE